jgi:signal transduction histidine kinase
MSRASRAIACGKLSFALPPSRVREVVEVSTAFGTMAHDLHAALARQAELEEERRFFVAAVAHDLRTPLFSLRGYLEGLSTGVASTPERAAHYIAVSQEKADELEHLIADLFAYTQVERLEQQAHHEPVDLSQLLARAVESVRPQAEAKSVTLTLEAPDAPALIEGDAHLLTRAVANLLDNALRHTPAGGAVDVCLRAAPERWVFTAVDTGPGFDARDLPHLFEPLYRGEASRSRQTGGSGMGLTIARRILRAHGGDLTAANHSTGGAELTGCVARAVTNL